MSTTKENDLWEDENSTAPEKNYLNNIGEEQRNTIRDTDNGSMLKAWKDTGKIIGIYKIINKVNRKYYVGSSLNVKPRWRCHKSTLRRNIHRNDYLQRAWNRNGKENFNFILVEKLNENTTLEQLLTVEQKYLDIAKTERDKCYNLNFEATGSEWNEYSKQKLSKRYLGKGNPMFGKHHTEESLKKIRQSSCERKHSEKSKEMMKTSARRRGISEENRKKINEGIHISHPNYFSKTHSFFNRNTNENFTGTLHDFVSKFKPRHLYELLNGKRKSEKGWMLNPQL